MSSQNYLNMKKKYLTLGIQQHDALFKCIHNQSIVSWTGDHMYAPSHFFPIDDQSRRQKKGMCRRREKGGRGDGHKYEYSQ